MNIKKATICHVILQIRELVDSLSSPENKDIIKEIHEFAEEAELYAKKMSKKLYKYAGKVWQNDVFERDRDIGQGLRSKYPFKYEHLL